MKKTLATICLLYCCTAAIFAQDINLMDESGAIRSAHDMQAQRDSLENGKKRIPRGLSVWTIDRQFGDIIPAEPDTLQHMFMNTVFTSGLYGEYNTTGNLGAPRLNRIFIDRNDEGEFIFTHPYDYFLTSPSDFLFTNTLSPITNLTFNSCGNRSNGEDHLKALFAVNIGKEIGLGFKSDYIYGRGYYQGQNTSHFNFTIYGSYLGEKYQAHFLASTNHQKVAENGGITDDRLITNSEIFNERYRENEIPTILSRNWNRNDNRHVLFTHRYSLGFNRKVPMSQDEIKARQFAIESKARQEENRKKEEARKKMSQSGQTFDEEEYNRQQAISGRPDDARIVEEVPVDTTATVAQRIQVDSQQMADSLTMAAGQQKLQQEEWMKNEYVPVTSFIHTLDFSHYRRIYVGYESPENYYANQYYLFGNDSINDQTKHYSLKNTFAIALLEGFNKWAKAGLRVFATHEFRHFLLPEMPQGFVSYNEHAFNLGGELSKSQGKFLNYSILGDFGVWGADAGQISLEANADLSFKLLGDTVTLAAQAAFHRQAPLFFHSHYHSKHIWWDNDELDNIIHSRIQGELEWQKTRTRIIVAADQIKNHVYLGQSYTITPDFLRTGNNVAVRQANKNIGIFTAALHQDLTLGIVNWENRLTFQKSTDNDAIPLPALNIYSNLYLRFTIAKVLKCDLGADLRFFTKYYAPDYSPALGQFTVQETGDQRVKLGNYPFVNAYANFQLKQARFFVMFSHVNSSDGNYFLTPHYPTNQRVLRFGISWNFFN